MEGQSIISNKLRFVESKRKFRVTQNVDNTPSYKLIAAANNHGWIILGFDDMTIKAVSTEQLLDFNQSKDKAEIASLNQYTFTKRLTFKPSLLTVARYGYSSILFVSGQNDVTNCPNIEIFDLDVQSSIGKLDLSELAGSEIVDYAWHPNYYDSIVALCTSRGHLLVLAVDRKEKCAAIVYNNQQYGALTCCWSPKGKNLAIGMFNGQILRLEPVVSASSFTFKAVDKSTLTLSHAKITPEHRIIKLRWINKTFLMSVHARHINSNSPDTIFSVITVKPSKPYRYWTNVCFENQIVSNYIVHLANLSNSVVCASNASGEAAVIGVDGSKEVNSTDVNDWNSIIIDEEGARIELPLDATNRETYPKGVTLAYLKNNDRPILIFYTSDGVICPYAAMHSENILKLPEFQQPQECPMKILKSNTTELTQNVISCNSTITQAPINLAPQNFADHIPVVQAPINLGPKDVSAFSSLTQAPINLASKSFTGHGSVNQAQINLTSKSFPDQTPVTQTPINLDLSEFPIEIALVKKGIEFNEVFLTLLDEINHLRNQCDEIEEIHKIHREVLNVIKGDIDSLDIGMLENLYLIEYIKSRSKGVSRKKSLDPMTLKKVESIKHKSKLIAEKIKDLNAHVDVSWEDFVRRRTALENKDRRLNSLDVIYKTLATNQKIINVLKRKVSANSIGSNVVSKSPECYHDTVLINRRELNPAKMWAFREFLSSRSVVPVRKPESVRQTSRKAQNISR